MIKTIRTIKIIILILLLPIGVCYAITKPSGPIQPSKGFGGKEYPHSLVKSVRIGIQSEQYHIFTPASPTPKSAGMVIFFHDRMTMDPKYYMGWIRHLCLKGWIVVYPKYQGSGDPDKRYFLNAVTDIKDAMKVIFENGKIELNREKIAIIGHGEGCVIGANIAATSRYFGIPHPKALLFAMPSKKFLDLKDLSGIKPGTKMLVIVGDKVDNEIKDTAREIFYSADRIKSRDKNYLTFLSDFHGSPPLVADRDAPLASEIPVFERLVHKRKYELVKTLRDKYHARSLRTQSIDGMDWLGTFRLFDAMSTYVFEGKHQEHSFGNTPQQRFMGYWSNGKRLRGLLSSERP